MDGETAIGQVRKICNYTRENFDTEIGTDDFHGILRRYAEWAFFDDPVYRKFEKVAHWILFDAGMHIGTTRGLNSHEQVVLKNGFDYAMIEEGLKKYGQHIRNLAALPR